MSSTFTRGLAALILIVCSIQQVRAQSIGDIDAIPRIHGPAGQRFMNDQPFSHRYNYGGSYGNGYLNQFYFNGDGRQLWHQDYLDRLDRAEKFGYDPPDRPRYGYPPDYDRPRLFGGGGLGLGFGRFRR